LVNAWGTLPHAAVGLRLLDIHGLQSVRTHGILHGVGEGYGCAYLTHRDGKKSRNWAGRADGDEAFTLSNRIRVRRQLDGLAR